MNTHNNTAVSGSFTDSVHLKFRPDIEGLRALAILVVIACHAGIPWMQGGFVGVDVFFVLSGYLISGLLIKEISNSGKINFIDFYARRLKRLLPALAVMTSGTAVLASIILAPMEQVTQASTFKWVPYWITNFIFSFSELDYFSSAAESNLFLHTWSLAIEEQFYLIWPVFIFGIFKSAQHGSRISFTSHLNKYFSIIFVLFLFLSILLSYIKPLWGFYLMPSRAWQFALGALTYIFTNRDQYSNADSVENHSPNRFLLFLSGWFGLALILVATLLLGERMVYPGFWALLPSFGAALIIFSGSLPSTNSISIILAPRPMQFIGKVSYAWYLWHWPVLVLGKALIDSPGVIYQLLLVLISLLFATATMFLIEAPVRQHRLLIRRPALTLAFSLLIMTTVYWSGTLWQNKSLDWANLPEQRIYSEVKSNLPVIYAMGCDDWYFSSVVRPCVFGDGESEKTAVLLGDSVGVQWFSALATQLVGQGWRFIVLTKSSCPLVDEPWFYPRIGEEYTICSDWRDSVIEFVTGINPDVLFMGSAAEYGFSPSQWQNGTKRVVSQLSENTGNIYIISSSFRLPFDGPFCLARKQWQPEFISNLNTCETSAGSPLDQTLANDMAWVASEFGNVGILDLNPLICPDNNCGAKIGDKIVYRDYQHLSRPFVISIAPEIFSAIENVQFGP